MHNYDPRTVLPLQRVVMFACRCRSQFVLNVKMPVKVKIFIHEAQQTGNTSIILPPIRFTHVQVYDATTCVMFSVVRVARAM